MDRDTAPGNSTVRYDPAYLRTLPGILRAAEVVLDLLGFICVVSTPMETHSSGKWFNTVALSGFFLSGILLGFYVFHIPEKFQKLPWLKTEYIFCGIWTICNFIAFVFISFVASVAAGLSAATEFGFCATTVYGMDGFLRYKAWGRGETAQDFY